MERKIIAVLLLIVLSVIEIDKSEGQAILRSAYGEHCNETMKCDKKAWLSCQSSNCTCMLAQKMIYDPAKGKCVSKSGERCRFEVDASVFGLYENTECVNNAICGSDFTCNCLPGFYENIQGVCVEEKDVDRECESSVECKQAKLLTCLNGTCQCSSALDHVYGPSSNSTVSGSLCVGKAGKQLSGGASCTVKAVVKSNDNICMCTPESSYYAAADGFCRRKKNYGDSCLRSEECIYQLEYLTCVEGKCGCSKQEASLINKHASRQTVVETSKEVKVELYKIPYGYDENSYHKADTGEIVQGTFLRSEDNKYGYISVKFDELKYVNLRYCVGRAGQPCNQDGRCVENSQCEGYKNKTSRGICKCLNAFAQTSEAMCGIGHGRPCSFSSPCGDMFLCTNGACDCPQINHQIYDAQQKNCVGLISSFCNPDDDCLPNSVCSMNYKTNAKQCACANGFVENSVGQCEIAWGGPCTNDGKPFPCDTIAELKCRNGYCACPDIMSNFNKTLRKCVGVVGSRCRFFGDTGLPRACVSNAACIQPHYDIAGSCLCNGGYSATKEMLCIKQEIEKPMESTFHPSDSEVNVESTDGAIEGSGALNSTMEFEWERP